MKVIITGGTGFIGLPTVKLVAAKGHVVVALHRGSKNLTTVEGCHWLQTPIDNPDWSQIEAYLGGCADVMIHLAAHGVNPMEAEWDDCFKYNTIQPIKLWRQAINRGLRRLVICGSFFEYGRSGEHYDFIPPNAPLLPTGAYGASKAAASVAACALAIESMIELVILRPALVYGEGEPINRFWPSLRKAALAGDDFPMTQGEQVRDFVPVDRVAEFFANSVSRNDLTQATPLIENIGTGNPRRLIDFATDWWKHWEASGRLLPGAIPYRDSECMRYVPQVQNPVSSWKDISPSSREYPRT